jgi:sugar O-acyltransferase (sialic acid O-acetyltransferase NeuD family)
MSALSATPSEDPVTRRRLAVLGAGGAGREIAWLAEACLGSDADIFFVVDDSHVTATSVNGRPVLTFEHFRSIDPSVPVVAAIGDPTERERLVARCTSAGFSFATLVHPSLSISPYVEIGEGSVICEGCVVTTNSYIGKHVYVNIGSTISHDCDLADYATLSPGVHIAGWVSVGRGVFFGTGATVRNGSRDKRLQIGESAVIGAGACVVEDVPAHATVVGVPARPR